MMYLRCKCGKSEWFGSDGPRPCQGCSECNTTYAGRKADHKEPEPHQWKAQFDRNSGEKTKSVCKVCYEREKPDG